ncbi:MAG: hypothetical protein IKV45_02650 [Firmicutes bacterium]|nr:hypothetical protein [Bacillota bacterium]
MKKRNVALTLLCCAGLLGLCGCGGGEDASEAITATVYVDAQVGGEFVYPFGELTVSSDAAENLGLTDNVSADTAVSALDVLVAANADLYGDAFAEDPSPYLNVEEGWIETAFEQKTDYWSILYNGESPHSDEESGFGGYTALIVNESVVNDGDMVEFIANQDDVNFADNALWIMKDGARISSLEIAAGETAEVSVKGYACSFYGTYGTEAIANEYLAPVSGVQLGIMAEDGTIAAIDGAVCDGEGNVAFSMAEAGEYVVVAYVPAGTDVYAFFAPLIVTVK